MGDGGGNGEIIGDKSNHSQTPHLGDKAAYPLLPHLCTRYPSSAWRVHSPCDTFPHLAKSGRTPVADCFCSETNEAASLFSYVCYTLLLG